jgi:C4-type Zn-finger protein
MSVRELERSLTGVRETLQEAIDLARDQQALKAMARQLLEHVNQVKLERDRMLTIALDNPMPLHLVCLQQGVSYRQASRLLAVNNIPQPNFTAGEVTVYGR